MNDSKFRCLLVEKIGKDQIRRELSMQPLHALPAGEVLVRVQWSSLNYKDALAAQGHPGVVRKFPHVPGIDAAGEVMESNSPVVSAGQQVIVTSHELGAGQWGAWSERIRVPADWVVPLPSGLDARSAMVFGTAGFTAALSVRQLQKHEITPERGPIAVSGASGGVGIIAVHLLRHLGYQVTAISGKADRIELLKQLGATDVMSRDGALDQSSKPLLAARWAGVIDTVGGPLLASLLRSSQPGACITACGMVGGVDIPISVYPFILRGITLSGIDSAWTPRVVRAEVWQRLAQSWNVSKTLESIVDEATLDQLEPRIDDMLSGTHVGRTIVRLS